VSRSKRRREKRKNRNDRNDRHTQGKHPDPSRAEGGDFQGGDPNERRPVQITGPKMAAEGMLELAPKGFGFLRIPGKNFEQARDDVFVTPEFIRRYNLRVGQWLHGLYQEGSRGPQFVELTAVNGMPPEQAAKLPHFDELKAINPTRRISFETTPERFTTRVVDIIQELRDYGCEVHVYDPHADHEEVREEYGLTLLKNPSDHAPYDGVVVAVKHRQFKELGIEGLRRLVGGTAVVADVKGLYDPATATTAGMTYWRL